MPYPVNSVANRSRQRRHVGQSSSHPNRVKIRDKLGVRCLMTGNVGNKYVLTINLKVETR